MMMNDIEYVFGRPVEAYVSPRQHAALLLLRSQIDTACRRIGRRELQGRAIEWNYTSIHNTAAARRITVELPEVQ